MAKETTKITYKRLFSLITILNAISYDKKNHFTYACQKIGNKLRVMIEKYNEKVEDMNVEFCKKDSENCIMREEVIIIDSAGNKKIEKNGDYKFDAEGFKKRRAMLKKLMEETIEIPIHLINDFEKYDEYKKLTFYQRNILAEIVLDIELTKDDQDISLDEWLKDEAGKKFNAGNGQSKKTEKTTES